MTPLDAAHARMEASDNEPARRAFWGLVAASELHLWLETEAKGADIVPRLFEIDGDRYALVFDGEDRVAAFAGGPSPYASLSGRRLAALLSEAGLGLGLNFGAPSQTLLPPGDVAWLAGTGGAPMQEATGRPVELAPPDLPGAVFEVIDHRLAAAEGLARCAWLATATWQDGAVSQLLAVEEAVPGATEPIARFVAEALAFAGAEVTLDATPVEPGSTLRERLERVAVRFDLPEPPAPRPPDSNRPPRLR